MFEKLIHRLEDSLIHHFQIFDAQANCRDNTLFFELFNSCLRMQRIAKMYVFKHKSHHKRLDGLLYTVVNRLLEKPTWDFMRDNHKEMYNVLLSIIAPLKEEQSHFSITHYSAESDQLRRLSYSQTIVTDQAVLCRVKTLTKVYPYLIQ